MTWRLETLEAHALNLDQRLNTIHYGIPTLNERSTTKDGPLNTIRQNLATADGHPINLNQRLTDDFISRWNAMMGTIWGR